LAEVLLYPIRRIEITLTDTKKMKL
jgi:hypothetical protein